MRFESHRVTNQQLTFTDSPANQATFATDLSNGQQGRHYRGLLDLAVSVSLGLIFELGTTHSPTFAYDFSL